MKQSPPLISGHLLQPTAQAWRRWATTLPAVCALFLQTSCHRTPTRVDRQTFFNNYAVGMITNADRVVVYPAAYMLWMSTNSGGPGPIGGADPEAPIGPGTVLPPQKKAQITQLLTDPNSYVFAINYSSLSVFAPDFIITFAHDREQLRCVFSIGSGELVFYADGKEAYFDLLPMRTSLAEFAQQYLPFIPPTWYDLTNSNPSLGTRAR